MGVSGVHVCTWPLDTRYNSSGEGASMAAQAHALMKYMACQYMFRLGGSVTCQCTAWGRHVPGTY